MADPAFEASTEETLGSGEPAITKPQILKHKHKHNQPLKQKQPARQWRAKNQSDSFAPYFPQVLKCVHMGMDLSLSQEAVSALDSFVKDLFRRIAREAGHLARSNKRATITPREIHTVVCLLLPSDLGKHAVNEGTKAILRYSHSE